MLDNSELLQPVSEEAPAGRDMSFSMEFDYIHDARREEDPHLEQGDWVRDLKEADWPKVNELAEVLLRQHTKDIRVAGWLIESRTKLQGFQGMASGLRLLSGLCQAFWNDLYPQIEDDDLQARAGNLAWIVNRAQELAQYVALTRTDGANYGLAFWDAANQLAHAIKRSPDEARALAAGRVTLDDIQEARSRTPAAYFQEVHRELTDCQTAVQELDQALQPLMGEEGPSLSGLKGTLESVSDLLKRFASESGAALVASTSVEPVRQPSAPASPVRVEPTIALPQENAVVDVKQEHISSRKQALEQLRQIAEFFRQTEPHSPVAYMAQKAADWGEMPLHEWLGRVVKNPEELAGLQEQLGVTQTQDGS